MNLAARWDKFCFESIPSRSLTFFRIAIGATTLIFFIPRLQIALSHSLHDPLLPWLPNLPACLAEPLILLQWLAACFLLSGVFFRAGAGFLALSGLFVLLSDSKYYAHWFQFHTTLLALLACSKNHVPLAKLFQKNTEWSCESWPKRLIQLQLSVVLFYSALDKVFSPYWGASGKFFTYEFGASGISAHPSGISLFIIGLEFFLALAFLFRPLWRAAVPIGLGFAIALELLIKPVAFTWDFMAVLILFI